MAQNRTLQFIGLAYGDTPVSVTAEINGTTVFSGEISTVNSPFPLSSEINLSTNPVLFTVNDSPLFPTNFSGSYPMTISATGGYGLVVGVVTCNYMLPSGNANSFASCYYNAISNVGDPRSNVIINGNPIKSTPPPNGAWYWEATSPGNIVCDLSVDLGNVA